MTVTARVSNKKSVMTSMKKDDFAFPDFGKKMTSKSPIIFYGNAALVSALPIWLYWRVHFMSLLSSFLLFLIMTAISTILLVYAYENFKQSLQCQIAQQREEAIIKEVTKSLSTDKKITAKERDERILWKTNEVSDYEATTFSIFFNNSIYLCMMIFLGFFLFRSLSPSFNYILSMSIASGCVALYSTSSNKH